MKIIRNSSFKSVPWKNGGGVTHEAIRVPEGSGAFRWRVSVAQIDTSGPFSDFADHRRRMVLLQGAGVRLTFDRGGQSELREVGDMVEFDGAWTTRCELLAGPCTDLNLMTCKSIEGSRAWTEYLREPRPLPTRRETVLIFVVSGVASLDDRGAAASLQAWDLAVASPGDDVRVGPAALDQSAAPLVFIATLDDNPL